MGNKPNNFIQCGFSDKDNKQQTTLTRQQAVRKTRQQSFPPTTFVQSKISSNNSYQLNTNYSSPTNSASATNNLLQVNLQKKFGSSAIPQHQNIVRISRTPKNKYLKNNDFFEQERGKCLDQIIQSRYHTTMHFPQNQIVGLLESLVYSLAYLTKKDINYHDFYPTNIFYNNGVFKILNPLVVKFSGYALTQQRKRFSFLSPQLILQILNDKPQLDIKNDVMDKSDVFAIGMILLEFCTLMPSSQCYDPQTYSIVDSIIQERVDKTNSLYNPLISQCIDLMLQYQVDKRISPLELAYAVHSKVMQIQFQQINQLSRINQMSRMAMSAKIPQIRPQGIPPQPILIQNPGLNFLTDKNRPINAQLQPILVSSNQITHPPNFTVPQNNQNITNYPKYSTTQINLPPTPLPVPLQSGYDNPIYLPQQKFISKNSNLSLEQNLYRKDLKLISKQHQVQRKSSSPQKKYYVTSQIKTLEPNRNLNLQQQQIQKNINQQYKKPALNQFSKYKVNPFEEIKEDLQEKQESPQNYKKYMNVKGFSTFSDKKQEKLYENKNYTSNWQTQGQSLDQRVKRILEASKNIK